MLWAFSMGCSQRGDGRGRAARRRRRALTLCPLVDGLPRVLRTPPGLVAWIVPRALSDLAGKHVTIPVTGSPGEHAAMTFEGERQGFAMTVAPELAVAQRDRARHLPHGRAHAAGHARRAS